MAIYADYNATSPLRPAAHEAVSAAMAVDGNPSSIHQAGRAARRVIEDARSAILRDTALVDYKLAFTSGATEALSMTLSADTQTPKGLAPTRLLINGTEHVAALDGHRFDDVRTLRVRPNGVIDLAHLAAELSAIAPGERALVCIQAANNETGVLQPLGEIEALCQTHNAIWVCDMVQWAGRLPMGVYRPDAVILSGHKIGGLAGIGALLYDAQRMQIAKPFIPGGGQERGLRGGTENLIGIAGFAAAISEASATLSDQAKRQAQMRDALEAQLTQAYPGGVVFGQDADRLPNTSCLAITGFEAPLALMQLDLAGIAISSGSACSSGKVRHSHVLSAMGVAPELAGCALRISFGFGSENSDVDRLVAAIKKAFPPQEVGKKAGDAAGLKKIA